MEIDLKLTQQDLAAMVGATRESVNKHLGWMRDHGLIQLDRQRIVLLTSPTTYASASTSAAGQRAENWQRLGRNRPSLLVPDGGASAR